MGKVYECIGRRANRPFFLDKICCNIYSAEELVYCIYENAELLEKDIFTTELADWLEEECGVRQMADRMYRLLNKKSGVADFAEMLLEEFPFVSSGQQERFLELLQEDSGADGPWRRKKRGDYFLHKGRYVLAVNEYESAIAFMKTEEPEFLGEVYHNMGMAHAGLFLLAQAKEDFLKAYRMDGKEEHYYYYAAAMRFSMSEGEYIRTISEDVQMREVTLKLEERVQEAAAKWKEGQGESLQEMHAQSEEDSEAYAEWIDKTIYDLKEEYRRCIQ